MVAMPRSSVDQFAEAVQSRGPRPIPKAQRARTKVVADALWSATKGRSKGAHRTRGGRRLEIMAEPEIIYDRRSGAEVGIQVIARLFDADGTEIPIDPVRRFENPPTEVATPEGQPNKVDPVAAFWSILWDQVEDFPAPEGWYA